jgi:universal stress protein A
VVQLKKILVPIDFSATALRAYDYAAGLCKTTGATLVALHVIPPVLNVETIDLADLAREAEVTTKAALATLRPKPHRSLIERGVPHDIIASVAQSIGADLIVIGTHGRSGLRHLVLGSVAENVVRHAPCPVLTVRSSE